MNAASKFLTSILYAVWRPFLRRRLGRVVLERVDGLPLVVLPDVFNPVVYRSGELLARTVTRRLEEMPTVWPSDGRGLHTLDVLDMGSGSGVAAIFAARRGCRVVAVDRNPEAVRCVRINALLNGVEDRIDVRCGDLFDPVAEESFDLALFNPPFYRGTPRDLHDVAWRGDDVLERFAAGLGTVLKPGGEALILLSTDGEGAALLHTLGQAWQTENAARRDFGNEVLTVYAARLGPKSAEGEPLQPELAASLPQASLDGNEEASGYAPRP